MVTGGPSNLGYVLTTHSLSPRLHSESLGRGTVAVDDDAHDSSELLREDSYSCNRSKAAAALASLQGNMLIAVRSVGWGMDRT